MGFLSANFPWTMPKYAETFFSWLWELIGCHLFSSWTDKQKRNRKMMNSNECSWIRSFTPLFYSCGLLTDEQPQQSHTHAEATALSTGLLKSFNKTHVHKNNPFRTNLFQFIFRGRMQKIHFNNTVDLCAPTRIFSLSLVFLLLFPVANVWRVYIQIKNLNNFRIYLWHWSELCESVVCV